MLKDPSTKYQPIADFRLEDRQWPSRTIDKAPMWCSVDLRDGNQALPNPMTPEQKLEYFKLLVDIGFKQIEVGFPSASEDDFSFCRKLIEENLIPDDVVISVLVQAREHLIDRTIEALKGAKTAVIHLYIATSELHRKYVFGLDDASVIKAAVDSTLYIKKGISKLAPAKIGFEFSPKNKIISSTITKSLEKKMFIGTSTRSKLACAFVALMLTMSQSLFAQGSGTLNGRVLDKTTSEALVGANVIVVSTNLGAAADIDGKFTIHKGILELSGALFLPPFCTIPQYRKRSLCS